MPCWDTGIELARPTAGFMLHLGASGNDCYITIEHGHTKIVGSPMKDGVFPELC